MESAFRRFEMLIVTIEVNVPVIQAQAVKEDLAMCLEKFGDTRVIDIQEKPTEQMKFK